ncbi:MAG: site-specific tyrosine recombinase XerC [Alphaproteobacteria bacterium ADurb.Bin438]|nr:MAG: site-specific tyrosine recombinase XerC [Alphaproteobacteria bacterium ADurb.Bin438]
MANLTKTFISSLKLGGDYTEWDDTLPCFGVRVRGTTKSWIIKYRNASGRQRKLTLGKTTKLTPEQAKSLAKQHLGNIEKGEDPAEDKQENRKSMTVAELCDRYINEKGWMARTGKEKKSSTITMDKSRIERHVKPLIGGRKVTSLTQQDLFNFMKDITDGKTAYNKESDKLRGRIIVKGGSGVASRTMGMLGAILQYAVFLRVITVNPARGLARPQDKVKDIRLQTEDIKTLGEVLFACRNEYSMTALNAIELLLLTGCRKMEVLGLTWNMIDFENQCFNFPDTKTGKQNRPFGIEAKKLLLQLRENSNSIWVFPASIGHGCYVGLPRVIAQLSEKKLKKTDKLPALKIPITAHVLRHTFASMAGEKGYSELTVAGLLGHKAKGVTHRYTHLPDKAFVSAADIVSEKIKELLEEGKTLQKIEEEKT